jgi:hypothetical protein
MKYNSACNKSQSIEDKKNYVQISGEKEKRRSGTIYRASGNLFIVRKTEKTVPNAFVGSTRGNISEFSKSSGTRMRRYLRECMAEYSQMVTLTYPGFFPTNGKAVKENLRRFIQEVRREKIRTHPSCSVDEVDYEFSAFWFLEFQKRGAPHFHIFLTWAPSKEWVASTWYRIVNSEDKRHFNAGTRTEFLKAGRAGTVSYAAKYAAKNEQKSVPEGYEDVGRFWGVSGRRATMAASTFVNSTEATELATRSTIKVIRSFVTHLIRNGKAQVLFKKTGECFVLNIFSFWDQRKMRSLVSRLACKTQTFDNMFCDAEVNVL